MEIFFRVRQRNAATTRLCSLVSSRESLLWAKKLTSSLRPQFSSTWQLSQAFKFILSRSLIIPEQAKNKAMSACVNVLDFQAVVVQQCFKQSDLQDTNTLQSFFKKE